MSTQIQDDGRDVGNSVVESKDSSILDQDRPGQAESDSTPTMVNPHSLMRLLQCPRCSRSLRVPFRLPCGNTLCRACLPPVTKRDIRVSYPQDESRKEGFWCFWHTENQDDRFAVEHSMGDCGVDVTVGKVVEVLEQIANSDDYHTERGGEASVRMSWTRTDEEFRTAVLEEGAYLGTFRLIRDGELEYDARDVVYPDMETLRAKDQEVLERFRRDVRNELDCQVCYGLLLDPVTSPCGHTFCRRCVAMIMDHSDLCPVCRRRLAAAMTAKDSGHKNAILMALIDILYPDEIRSRRESAEAEGDTDSERDVPLFISTISFPHMPTFLHVFEDRYRLMMRRVMEHRNGRFGMVMYNLQSNNRPLRTFMPYGTMLRVDRFEYLPDGRSLVSTVGTTKFKVVDFNVVDDYYVARIERVDDLPLAEEEALEARELAANPRPIADAPSPDGNAAGDQTPIPLEALTTQELYKMCLDYAEKRGSEASPWLHRRILSTYGPPPTDPARFPYWLASILPLSEKEKYKLLPMRSVRERLKLAASWVRMFENPEW